LRRLGMLPSQWGDGRDGLGSVMRSLDEFAAQKLGELDRRSLRRALTDTARVTGIWVLRNGRRLLSFSCNDYLNLTHHPAVKEAAIQALRLYGVGAGASRLVTGNHPLYAELESRLARLKPTTCLKFWPAFNWPTKALPMPPPAPNTTAIPPSGNGIADF